MRALVFSSLLFLYIFMPVCLLLYFMIPQLKAKNGILIVFSLLFYAWGAPVYVPVLVGTAFVNYLSGLFLQRQTTPVGRKFTLVISLALNLSSLAFFKYSGFLVESFNAVTSLAIPVPRIVMPIGISFFTFQSMSYTIDVYRNQVGTQRSFWRFLLYVSLFPQLIAGPVVRYSEIEPQLQQRTSTAEDVYYGLFRFCIGLGKKVLLADHCSKAVTLLLGGSFTGATVAGTWFGMIMYALQIYFDFSGYSDMAIGLGRVFGFRYHENFNLPYIAHSITDFWRRWHISMGSFFRDYVYIPMGGNRRHQFLNLLVVWALTGLWHGASWNFVLWGLYFFVLLVLEKSCRRVLDRIPKFVRIPVTLLLVVLGWTLFYFTDFTRLGQALSILFGGAPAWSDLAGMTIRNNLPLLAVCIIGCTPLPRMLGGLLASLGRSENNTAGGAMQWVTTVLVFLFDAAIIFFATASLAGSSYTPFLYWNF